MKAERTIYTGSGSVHCADWISLQDCHEHIDRHRPVAGTMEQRAIDRPPLKLKEIWAIRMRLQFSSRVRDLAMFNLAIDSKLRARDLTKLRVCDVCHKEHVASRATIMQQKTQRPGNYRADSRERGGLDKAAGLHATDFNSPSRIHDSPHLSTRQYARLVHRWIASIGLDDTAYGTHTMRRTKRL
jgi:hypothetical protein